MHTPRVHGLKAWCPWISQLEEGKLEETPVPVYTALAESPAETPGKPHTGREHGI